MPDSSARRTDAQPNVARKVLGRAIEQALHQWVDAINAIASPIFIHDQEFHIMHANRAYAACAGMAAGKFIGKPYWKVFPKGKGPLPGCARAMQDPETTDNQDEVVTAKGDVYLSKSFGIRDKAGEYLHSVHVMENITERRRAEEQQRVAAEVFNAAAESIMILDARMSITDVNRAYTATTGYTLQGRVHAAASRFSRSAFSAATSMPRRCSSPGAHIGKFWRRRESKYDCDTLRARLRMRPI